MHLLGLCITIKNTREEENMGVTFLAMPIIAVSGENVKSNAPALLLPLYQLWICRSEDEIGKFRRQKSDDTDDVASEQRSSMIYLFFIFCLLGSRQSLVG